VKRGRVYSKKEQADIIAPYFLFLHWKTHKK